MSSCHNPTFIYFKKIAIVILLVGMQLLFVTTFRPIQKRSLLIQNRNNVTPSFALFPQVPSIVPLFSG